MRQICWFLLAIVVLPSARADTLLPSAIGTRWTYALTQEFGEGVQPSNAKPDPDGKVRLPVDIFVAGTEKVGSAEAIKYEMYRQGVVSMTEFYAVGSAAVTALARAGEDGAILKADPPQKMFSLPPVVGEKWNYEGKFGDNATKQTYEIMAEEPVTVSAGTFNAFHLRVTQIEPTPPKIVEDRWFVPNVGYVKMVTEMTLGNGALLQRIALDLKEGPKHASRPELVGSKPAEKKPLSAALAKELTGEPMDNFASDLPKIYARWQGETLKKGDKVRAAWVAEDVGSAAPKNYKVDEATLTAKEARAFGTFTLSRPNQGWPLGKYRVEFYVDDELVEAVKFRIEK